MEEHFSSTIQAVAAVVQSIALVVAGVWAYKRFRKERIDTPNIEFVVNCNFYGPVQRQYISEFLITIRNKGVVLEEIRKIHLRVRGIRRGEKLKLWKEHDPESSNTERLFFPARLWEKKYEGDKGLDIVPKNYKPYSIEPGCEETITYVTMVPAEWNYILAHVRYSYGDTVDPKRKTKKKIPDRTAERVWEVTDRSEHSMNK